MPGKRSGNINGAILFIRILSKLSTHQKRTAKDILESLRADDVEVELRTVQRALKDLTESDFFPIDCDDTSLPYGYRLKSHSPGFRVGRLSPYEALLLQLAREQLRYQMPERLVNSMAGLFEDASYHIRANRLKPASTWLKKVRVVSTTQPLMPPAVHKGVFTDISEALFENRYLEVWYHNKEKVKKHKTVMPVALVQQGVRLYLVCQFRGYDNYRHLALHRIEKTAVSMETFDYPKDFDLMQYDADGHFGFGEGKKVRLTMEVANSLADDLDETPLAKDQTIVFGEDTSIVECTIVDSRMLDWWIQSYGDTIKCVEKTPIAEALED
ncbi:MAG: WYL domain-containing transcriptional regulator [Burkholderiaceae bacterium]|nr:WYL domain-containing transcriptional regulator [Burkholderiaceae bacterium]